MSILVGDYFAHPTASRLQPVVRYGAGSPNQGRRGGKSGQALP
ncbi:MULTISPECIES: hypothetical protein [unclassified Moorena]|nr:MULTISPECIES: hypothetical protein [unclassified Moorena]